MRKSDVRTFSAIAIVVAACMVLAGCLAGCRSLPPPTPLDQLDPAQMHGYRVFQAHCASCHHDRDSDPLHGPGLAGMYRKKYLPSGAPANDERVMNTILRGRNNMPALGNQLDPMEADDLLAYLHTL